MQGSAESGNNSGRLLLTAPPFTLHTGILTILYIEIVIKGTFILYYTKRDTIDCFIMPPVSLELIITLASSMKLRTLDTCEGGVLQC